MIKRIFRLIFRRRPETFEEVQAQLEIEVRRLKVIAANARVEEAEWLRDTDFTVFHGEQTDAARKIYQQADEFALSLSKLIIAINNRSK